LAGRAFQSGDEPTALQTLRDRLASPNLAERLDCGGFSTAFFAVITGFALIWHIWWMASMGVLGIFLTLLVFAFRDEEEIEIPAEAIAEFDRAHPTEVTV